MVGFGGRERRPGQFSSLSVWLPKRSMCRGAEYKDDCCTMCSRQWSFHVDCGCKGDCLRAQPEPSRSIGLPRITQQGAEQRNRIKCPVSAICSALHTPVARPLFSQSAGYFLHLLCSPLFGGSPQDIDHAYDPGGPPQAPDHHGRVHPPYVPPKTRPSKHIRHGHTP